MEINTPFTHQQWISHAACLEEGKSGARPKKGL